VSFNGGFCFIKPKDDSHLELSFLIKEKCRNYKGIRELQLTALDLKTILNFYIAGDATGSSIDLTSIETFPLRFTIAPDDKILNLSDDFGSFSPQFSSAFEVADIHLGIPDIHIENSTGIRLRPVFWIDHNCKKRCTNNYCQSLCDYAQPFSGNFTLTELNGNVEGDEIANWKDGVVAGAQFQGELLFPGIDLESSSLESGKVYRLKIVMTDPKFDFDEFKEGLFSKIGNLKPLPGRLNSGMIPDIPVHQTLHEISRTPIIGVLPDINFGFSISNSFERLQNTFSSFFNYKAWPPYYEKICGEKECSVINQKPYLTMSLDFKINLNDKNDLIPLKQTRLSKYISSYSITNPIRPQITCPYK
jgi:hypothetical protein